MDYKQLRDLEWMLGGDITQLPKEEKTQERDSLTESLSLFISSFDNIETSSELLESAEQLNLMEEFIKIQEAIDSIKEKMGDRLDEDALTAAFLVPVIATLGMSGIGIAVKGWMNGDALIPVTVWKALDKISRWINGDPKKANQFKSIVSKTNGISPIQAAKFTNIVANREEMMKRFPRMATK